MSRGFKKFLLGASIGAGISMLFTKNNGKVNREQLKQKIDDIKTGLSELDKEKTIGIAKEKSNDIKNKLEDLVKYTIDKGTPVLEKSANIVKEKTILVMKQILDKLEQEEK